MIEAVKIADIVRSLAGRDAGQWFLVLKTENGFAYLTDGKGRKCECPKKKKLKHLDFAAKGQGPAAEKLMRGEPPTNREIIRSLAEFRRGRQNAEEGS